MHESNDRDAPERINAWDTGIARDRAVLTAGRGVADGEENDGAGSRVGMTAGRVPTAVPWQVEMFNHSLKKRQKLELLLEMLGPLEGRRCLLVTHGDNPGSLNHQLREAGGDWSWAELEPEGIPQMEELLEEPVHAAEPDGLPFPSGSMDVVVTVDVHEHMTDASQLNREIARVLAPGGTALLTTPNGQPGMPVSALKRWVGMDNRAYGHVVQGYTVAELEGMLRDAGLKPVATGAYSRFFTEFAELVINFGYVKVLPRLKGRRRAPEGVIAPRSASELQSVGGAYRAYRAVYPAVRAFSSLDRLVPGEGGYAVAVAGRKE